MLFVYPFVNPAFRGLKAWNTDIDLKFYANDDKSSILPKDCSFLFKDADAIQNIWFGKIDASHVTNMKGMFAGRWSLGTLDISNFDVANVTSMEAMFSGCSRLQNLIMENLSAQKVTTMQNMFYGCRSLEKLSLKGSNFTNVKNMANVAFSICGVIVLILLLHDEPSQTFDSLNQQTELYSFFLQE